MELQKLFIAYILPQSVRQRIGEQQRLLADMIGSGDILRMVANDKLHLTLLFIGETAAAKREVVVSAMVDAVHECERVSGSGDYASPHLSLTQIGAFPSIRRPRVVWIGARDSTGYTESLARGLRVHVVKATTGISGDLRPFVPHITIGYPRRHITPDERNALTRALNEIPMPLQVVDEECAADEKEGGQNIFPIKQVALIESVPTRSGTRYETRYAIDL